MRFIYKIIVKPYFHVLDKDLWIFNIIYYKQAHTHTTQPLIRMFPHIKCTKKEKKSHTTSVLEILILITRR